MADRRVIDSEPAYRQSLELIAGGTGPIAVDAERASGFRYSQRAYLIQMYRRDAGTFLFDPPAIGRFDELSRVIADDEWVLHAASQDLSCLHEVGLFPTKVFDTELAARLLGLPKVGLGTVVEDLLGIHLAKEHSAADWSTRPLPQSWLTYAALDVELLIDLRDTLAKMLQDADKSEIAQQEFEAERLCPERTPRAEPWRRLSGIHSLKGLRALAIARELWNARDALARETDIAPGRLVPDASLTAAVKAMPQSKAELAALREFNGRASHTEIDRWWAAFQAGRSTEDLPKLRSSDDVIPAARAWADRNPEADARLKASRTAMAVVSEKLSIPVENLLTPKLLRQLAWAPPDPADRDGIAAALAALGARRWQIEVTSGLIAQAFVDASQPKTEPPESTS
ncbi:MAG: HRDC domain-containing protein [Microbacteriaceae bacterium]